MTSNIAERAVHRGELTLSAVDVAAHWHQHFKADTSSNDKILNDQAVCFFQIAEGADLGKLVIGRKGQPTRFEFDAANSRALAEGSMPSVRHDEQLEEDAGNGAEYIADEEGSDNPVVDAIRKPETGPTRGNRVFITHGKNKKILEQVKEHVAFGKFEPVVAQERETAAKAVPDKVMDEMRTCQVAVIHVGSEGSLLDSNGKKIPKSMEIY